MPNTLGSRGYSAHVCYNRESARPCVISRMKQLLRSSTTFLGAIIAGLIVITLLTIGIVVSRTHAAQTNHKGSLITIYDRGVSKVIATNDATIGDALHDAGITLAKQDVVEPAASQKIVASEYQVNIYRAR